MPSQLNLLHHRGHLMPQNFVLASVQKVSPSPVSAPLVYDLALRLSNRYFTDDVVYVNLHNEWHHGVISEVFLRTDRTPSTGDAFRIDPMPHRIGVDLRTRSDSSTGDAFRIDPMPHRIGVDLRTRSDMANLRDNPRWYLYRVTLSNQSITQDLDLVSSDRLSRDLGFLSMAIAGRLPPPPSRYPSGRRLPPRLQNSSQVINPMTGAPFAQVNIAFGGGTFVSGNGAGTTQYNSGTFNDVTHAPGGVSLDEVGIQVHGQ
ncbi:hypothetical protein HGRIS_001076 [Hohenbuehelia grisea]|uniref:Uncharacterized protein n=1 Tax=Hohenbuehelia grisea TaxID=104357 RepID=A0ABR3JP74_9AGAR